VSQGPTWYDWMRDRAPWSWDPTRSPSAQESARDSDRSAVIYGPSGACVCGKCVWCCCCCCCWVTTPTPRGHDRAAVIDWEMARGVWRVWVCGRGQQAAPLGSPALIKQQPLPSAIQKRTSAGHTRAPPLSYVWKIASVVDIVMLDRLIFTPVLPLSFTHEWVWMRYNPLASEWFNRRGLCSLLSKHHVEPTRTRTHAPVVHGHRIPSRHCWSEAASSRRTCRGTHLASGLSTACLRRHCRGTDGRSPSPLAIPPVLVDELIDWTDTDIRNRIHNINE